MKNDALIITRKRSFCLLPRVIHGTLEDKLRLIRRLRIKREIEALIRGWIKRSKAIIKTRTKEFLKLTKLQAALPGVLDRISDLSDQERALEVNTRGAITYLLEE
jgi:hypothetical protein